VEDLLTLMLQSEAAASFEPLLDAGLLGPGSPWYSLVVTGRQTPATAYVKVSRCLVMPGGWAPGRPGTAWW
jgi:hypothetical protein